VKDEREATVAGVAGSQGVVAGTGNVQNNTWTSKPTPDLAALSALNPHVAVTRLQRLSHDDLVDLFAKAFQCDLAEVLTGWLAADEPSVVAVLADINPRRSSDLIAPLTANAPWLQSLPVAAVDMGAVARKLKWRPASAAEYVQRTDPSPSGGTGYCLRYENGLIYWSDYARAYGVSGPIAKYHQDKGGTGGELGFPIGDEAQAQASPLGATGVCQRFEGGVIYASKHGAYRVSGTILDRHDSLGGTAGWLGFPVKDCDTFCTARGLEVGAKQDFEGGACLALDDHACGVRGAVMDYLDAFDVPDGDDEFDIDDEFDTPDSPFGTSGLAQVFKLPGAVEFRVYTTEKYGIHLTAGSIREYHVRIGGTASWLGFPKGDPTDSSQGFEGGTIYAGGGCDPVAVASEIMELIGEDSPPWGQLGIPVSAEKVVASAGDESIQFFANGIVTLRDGKREIWLRRESQRPSISIPPIQDGVNEGSEWL
jgi:LGFP repeat